MAKNFEIKKTVGFGKALYMTVTEDGKEPVIVEYPYEIADALPPFPTIESIQAFMTQTRVYLDTLASAWGEAANEGNKALVPLMSDIVNDAGKLTKLYNGASLAKAFKDCAMAPKAMFRAAEVELYETLSAKEAEDKDTHIKSLEIITRMKRIPLDKLHKKLSGIGEKKDWIYEAQFVNKLFVSRAIASCTPDGNADAVLKAINDSYAMDDIAKAIKAGKTPTSNTALLKAVRNVVSMMIGEEYSSKVNSHDIKHMCDLYITEYKKDPTGMTKQVKTHKQFYDLFLIICHKAIVGGEYKVFCKELQSK